MEKPLKDQQSVKAIKNDLKHIDSYIEQFEDNQSVWGKHKKLRQMYNSYKKYKKAIDAI